MRLFMFLGFMSIACQLSAETLVTEPGVLDKDNETYVLQNDISVDGTAFTIDGDNITFDLNQHEITYNKATVGSGIFVIGNNNTVTNGYIVQGAGRSGLSAGVELNGYFNRGGHTVSYLGIKVNPEIQTEDHGSGVALFARQSTVHNVYIENNGTTSNISYSPRGIQADHRTTAGFTIRDNIIVNSHIGIHMVFVGLNTETPDKSNVFNNLIQHTRSPGTKAPYGIQLAKTRNVNVYNNQVISDDGRGIMLDGFGMNVPRGTDFCEIFNNKVDVEYSVVAESGEYVENNVYGVRDRYSSGNNSFYGNTVMVNNEAPGGITAGMFIGSDGIDPLMTNLNVNNNKIIVRNGYTGAEALASALRYSVSNDLSVTDNDYIGANFSICGYSCLNSGGIGTLVEETNAEITTTSYEPAKPAGLKLRKFFDSYVLTWNDNNEEETLEYIVYKNSVPIEGSTRGGTFYVDTNVTGTHEYTVVAKNLNRELSVTSDPISTNDAFTGWTDDASRPLPPQNLQKIQK